MRTRSMVRTMVVAGVAAALALAPTVATADPGDPDPGWSDNGLARDGLGDDASGVRVLVLGNGKVIVAGDIDEGGPTDRDVLLARYTAGGELDTTFSGDGYRSIAVSGVYDTAWALARQSNGRYLLGGSKGANGKAFVLRTLANGDLDSSFSGDGIASPSLPGYSGGYVWKLLVQPDGKVLAAGEAYPTGGGSNGSDLMVLRFRTNGTLDPSFSGDGRLLFDVAGGEDTAWHAGLVSNGKILGIGTANTAADEPRVAVFRINANGTLDHSFSGDGVADDPARADDERVRPGHLPPVGRQADRAGRVRPRRGSRHRPTDRRHAPEPQREPGHDVRRRRRQGVHRQRGGAVLLLRRGPPIQRPDGPGRADAARTSRCGSSWQTARSTRASGMPGRPCSIRIPVARTGSALRKGKVVATGQIGPEVATVRLLNS